MKTFIVITMVIAFAFFSHEGGNSLAILYALGVKALETRRQNCQCSFPQLQSKKVIMRT